MKQKWMVLAENLECDRRQEVCQNEIDEALLNEIRQIKASIQTIREILFFEGVKVTDDYVEMMRQTRFSKDETSLYPRVRYNKDRGTVSFYWERIEKHIHELRSDAVIQSAKGRGHSYLGYVKGFTVGAKRKVKVVLTSKHVRINKKSKSIPSTAFDREPDWVRIAGAIVEKRLCRLRKENDALASLSRRLYFLDELLKSRIEND